MPRPAHVIPLLALLVASHAGPAAADAGGGADPRPPAWRAMVPGPDRLQHAGLSFTIAAGVGIAARAPWPGAGVSLAFGVAKELHDRRTGHFDPLDLTADAIGAALGALATRALVR